jgi:probable O-glycosylation ligase (exosortase A-associated)
MRDAVLLALVFGSLPFALARPQFGLLLWAAIGYVNPHRFTYGIAYDFPIVQVVAVATLIGLVFTSRRTPFPTSAITTWWTLFVLWFCLTTLFALVPDAATDYWQRAIKIQIMILATLWLMGTRERIEATVWVIALSIGVFGVKGGLFALVTGGEYRVWGPPDSFIEGNNEIALALIIVLPLMRYLQVQVNERWRTDARLRRLARPVSWSLTIAMVLSGFAILSSYSRGAFIGGAAMLVMLFARSRGRWYLGPVLALAVISAVAFMPDKWTQRMTTISSYQKDASAQGRINAWWFAYNLAKDRPVLGGGFEAFDRTLFPKYAPNPDDLHDAHSIYFQVMAEQGFVGFILFLGLGAATLIAAGRAARKARSQPDLKWAADLCAMLQVALVGYASGGAFLGLAYFDLPYHLVALVALTQAVVRRELREREAATASTAGAASGGRMRPDPLGTARRQGPQ